MLAVSFLAGILGACLTQNSRINDTSNVQMGTAIILPNLQKYIGGGRASDVALSGLLGTFLNISFGLIVGRFITDSFVHRILVIEALDAFRYQLGDFEEKTSVEARRIIHAGDTNFLFRGGSVA